MRGGGVAQIDYINLTYTCSGMDVYEMREFLDDNNGENIKIIAKVGSRCTCFCFRAPQCPGAADAFLGFASNPEGLL